MCSVFIDERGRDPQVKERAETDISVPHAPVRGLFAQRSVQRLMFAQSCYKRSWRAKG
ncbi:unnamed protein product [Brassica rapa subsp. trilocularis]